MSGADEALTDLQARIYDTGESAPNISFLHRFYHKLSERL